MGASIEGFRASEESPSLQPGCSAGDQVASSRPLAGRAYSAWMPRSGSLVFLGLIAPGCYLAPRLRRSTPI